MSIKPFKKTSLGTSVRVKDIVTVLSYELQPNFRTEEESHDFYELVYAEGGRLTCFSGDKAYSLKQGEIILHPPEVTHSLSSDKRQGGSAIIIGFSSNSPVLKKYSDLVFEANSSLSASIRLLLEECDKSISISRFSVSFLESSPFGAEQMIRLRLEELLIRLVRSVVSKNSEDSPTDKKGSVDYPLSRQICDYLKERVSERVTLKDICVRFHFGKSRLSELFKRDEGVTIIEYFTSLKIEEAKRLLAEKKTVGDTALRLGFESAEYFSRTFKKITGLSPKQYKEYL